MQMITQGTQFPGFSRGKTKLDEIVLHESVSPTREKCISDLLGKKLSVHFSVDRDGSVHQHLDPKYAGAHAEGFNKPSLHNERSIAIEVINPYYGSRATLEHEVIKAVWAHKGKYILPTPEQLNATWDLVESQCAQNAVPCIFPGMTLSGQVATFKWGRLIKHEIPGVMAHARWAHADALFVEHYCAMRSLGWMAEFAYQLTVDSGASGKRKTDIPLLQGSV
jgi:hypothetical protein